MTKQTEKTKSFQVKTYFRVIFKIRMTIGNYFKPKIATTDLNANLIISDSKYELKIRTIKSEYNQLNFVKYFRSQQPKEREKTTQFDTLES